MLNNKIAKLVNKHGLYLFKYNFSISLKPKVFNFFYKRVKQNDIFVINCFRFNLEKWFRMVPFSVLPIKYEQLIYVL
nr:hypothetical protein [Zobellia laminariae]